jgi:hypothetical protein
MLRARQESGYSRLIDRSSPNRHRSTRPPGLLVTVSSSTLVEMLSALSKLGESSGSPQYPEMPGEASSQPMTPSTPTASRGSRYIDRSLLTPTSNAKWRRTAVEAGASPSECFKNDARQLLTPTGPRRSGRLRSRGAIPPTPESLPTLSPARKVQEATASAAGTKRARRKPRLVAPPRPEIIVGPTEEGKVESMGKIHLIQGKSASPPVYLRADWTR